ncbi:MAG: hypothetical protein JWO22_1153, partial [Frankiales bacterium]|nr:hypothetical protein [Frankiales bacterium]
MSLPPAVRRSLALLASTTLLTTGAAGLFTGTAFALPNTGVPTSISPASTNNSGTSAATVTGTGFNPSSDHVLLAAQFQSAYGAAGTPGLNGTTDQQSSDTSHLVGTLPTSNAAPGVYDVYTARTDATGTTVSTKCAG